MKLKPVMLLTLALPTLVASAASLDDYKLKIDDKEYGYLFADQTLTEPQQEEILKDLHTLLISMKPMSVYRLAPKYRTDETALTINGVGYRYEFRIEFGEAIFNGLELTRKEIGKLATSKDNADYILVSTELSNAYKKAFKFVKQHEKAYKQLPAFIEMLNSPDIKTLPPLADLIYLPVEDREEWEEEITNQINSPNARERFVDVLKKGRNEMCSVLELTESYEAFAANIHFYNRATGERGSSRMFLYKDGGWRKLFLIY